MDVRDAVGAGARRTLLSDSCFENEILITLLGFVSKVVIAKSLMRGEVLE